MEILPGVGEPGAAAWVQENLGEQGMLFWLSCLSWATPAVLKHSHWEVVFGPGL